uniref:Putative secreted protein n=1 Tax=Anopheles marajoara TaxID=58244 RepID=A0A2M4CBM7_9DIPT
MRRSFDFTTVTRQGCVCLMMTLFIRRIACRLSGSFFFGQLLERTPGTAPGFRHFVSLGSVRSGTETHCAKQGGDTRDMMAH